LDKDVMVSKCGGTAWASVEIKESRAPLPPPRRNMPRSKRTPKHQHRTGAAKKTTSRKAAKSVPPPNMKNRRASTLMVTTDKPLRHYYSNEPESNPEYLKSVNETWFFFFWPTNELYDSLLVSTKAVTASLHSRAVSTRGLHFFEKAVFRTKQGEWLYVFKTWGNVPTIEDFRSSLDEVTPKHPSMVIQDVDCQDSGVLNKLLQRSRDTPQESSNSKERAAGPAPASNDDERPVALRKGKRNLVQSRVA